MKTNNINKKNILYSFYNVKILIFLTFTFFIYIILNKYTNFYIPCIFHKITGFYCPGCGITRMFLSLIELDLKGAFEYNQLVFLLLPILFVYFILEIRQVLTNKLNIMNDKKFKLLWIILIIITIIFGILRNLECFEFLVSKS